MFIAMNRFQVLPGDGEVFEQVWLSRDDLEAWTRSEPFRGAHRGAGGQKPPHLVPSRFKGFEVSQTVTSS